MTETTEIVCDMCGEVQKLPTSPKKWLSNYYRISREGLPITEDTPDALCPKCGPTIFNAIKQRRREIDIKNNK